MNGLRLLFALLCLAFIAVSAKAVQSYSIAGAQPDPMLAVVKIITDKGHGSGFHMGNGHIITAAHVLRGASVLAIIDPTKDARRTVMCFEDVEEGAEYLAWKRR